MANFPSIFTAEDKAKLAKSLRSALEILEQRGPQGVDTNEGLQAAGSRFPARVWELEHELGCEIKREKIKGSCLWRYTLLGKRQSGQLALL